MLTINVVSSLAFIFLSLGQSLLAQDYEYVYDSEFDIINDDHLETATQTTQEDEQGFKNSTKNDDIQMEIFKEEWFLALVLVFSIILVLVIFGTVIIVCMMMTRRKQFAQAPIFHQKRSVGAITTRIRPENRNSWFPLG